MPTSEPRSTVGLRSPTVHRRRPPVHRLLIAATAAALLAITGCAGPSDHNGRTKLVIADSFSTKHPVGAAVQAFVKALRAEGPGVGLDVDYYAAGQLGKQKEMLTLVRTRAVDMGILIPSYLANELPLSGVGDLPGLVSDPCTTTRVLDPLMRPGGIIYERELKPRGVVPIYGASISGVEVFTANTPVPTPDRLTGKLIRSSGGVADRVVSGLGATPIAMPVNDLYEAVSRGTVQGTALARYAMLAYSLQEVLRYGTSGANLGSVTTWMSINAKVWDSLDERQKKVILTAGETARAAACTSVATADAAAIKALQKAGVTFDEVTPTTRPAWDNALAGVRDGWTRDLDSAGLPASEVLSTVESRIGEVAQ